MATIYNLTEKKKIDVAEGERLFDVLLREGIPVSAPCGGQGTCGKCHVKILNCDCPPSSLDKEWFTQEELDQGIRLSCTLRVSDGLSFITDSSYHHDHLAAPLLPWKGPAIIPDGGYDPASVGIAVDIGTQNVKISFLQLNSGQELKRIYVRNRQMVIGNDVVARMNFVLGNDRNYRLMQNIIVNTIEEAITAGAFNASDIKSIAVAGNSVMTHLFLRTPVDTLAKQPFQPLFTDGKVISSEEIGFRPEIHATVMTVPLLGSFVGGDITADLVYTDLLRKKGNHILIDLGTNGEIVMTRNGKAYATSTAAGPAFEGATIRHGMLALPGAIRSFQFIDGHPIYETVDQQPAKGICGSGLLDVIAELVRLGLIDPNGRLMKRNEAPQHLQRHFNENNEFILGGEVTLTQQDIREVQLAKGAIHAGIARMLEITQSKLNDFDKLYLLGNFGQSIHLANAKLIGLIPQLPDEKIEVLGDVAVDGTRMILLSNAWREEAKRIGQSVETVNISDSATFQDLFVDGMLFNT